LEGTVTGTLVDCSVDLLLGKVESTKQILCISIYLSINAICDPFLQLDQSNIVLEPLSHALMCSGGDFNFAGLVLHAKGDLSFLDGFFLQQFLPLVNCPNRFQRRLVVFIKEHQVVAVSSHLHSIHYPCSCLHPAIGISLGYVEEGPFHFLTPE